MLQCGHRPDEPASHHGMTAAVHANMADISAEHNGCYIKGLPRRLLVTSNVTAREIYSNNAAHFANTTPDATGAQNIAVLTSKYWGPNPRVLTVSFLESQLAPAELQQRILSHMNAWNCCISFELAAVGTAGDVRISLGGQDGNWSYLGTDILHVPDSLPTMSLQSINTSTPDSVLRQVVRHEAGHTLAFPHEHLRQEIVNNIDTQKALEWFEAQGWPAQQVEDNILVPIEQASIRGTPADTTSIMCYMLPGYIMKDGQRVPGGLDINETDYQFCWSIYPKPGASQPTAPLVLSAGAGFVPPADDDWGPGNDVDITEKLKKFTQ